MNYLKFLNLSNSYAFITLSKLNVTQLNSLSKTEKNQKAFSLKLNYSHL